MKNWSILLILAMIFSLCSLAAQNPHTVLFYNVENLFDTLNDPNFDDDEFTVRGKKRWTSDKYFVKISNIERVISDISSASLTFPALIGFAEVESLSVLKDIVATPSLGATHYEIVHYESRDERGIDVAAIYRPGKFKLTGSRAYTLELAQKPDFRSRDILSLWGTIEGEEFFFVVTHAPSRIGGVGNTNRLREANALKIANIVDSVRVLRPKTKFILLGDFNDNPIDASIKETLGVRGDINSLEKDDLYSPFYSMFMAGYGSSAYRGEWNMFDNIIVSANLVKAQKNELQILRSIYNSQFYGDIFKPFYLIQHNGRFAGYPFRTYSFDKWIGGYSDHLPVFITID